MKFRFSRKKQVVGIDLGQAYLKAVLLQLNVKTGEVLVENYATVLRNEPEVPLEEALRILWNKLKTKCLDCAVALWPEGGSVRVFEPATSSDRIRELMEAEAQPSQPNDLVVDCAPTGSPEKPRSIGCAMPRAATAEIEAALKKLKKRLSIVQLAPIAIFNAFVVSHEKVAKEKSFLLVDIGSNTTTILGGQKGGLRFSRTLAWGTKAIEENLICEGGLDPGESLEKISETDDINLNAIKRSMQVIARDIAQSLQYLQGQSGSFIEQVYLSGWLSSQKHLVTLLQEEVTQGYSHTSVNERTGSELTQWNPLRSCTATDLALSDFKLLTDLSRLPAASGAAFQYLL